LIAMTRSQSSRRELLHPGDYVVCADEKPSIQARARKHPTLPARPREPQKVEHAYERKGALCYLAGWDVKHARTFDRCAPKSPSSCPSTPTSRPNACS
jgi:hypothetical protein